MKTLWRLTGITLLLYLRTLTSGLPPIDVGEFIGCAKTFGIPHPTGYPIYLLVARLFAMLPIDTIKALSILSALAATASFFFLAWAAKDESKDRDGWWLVLLYPITALVWNSAIRPEVYAFNLFFLAGALWSGFRVWNGNRRAAIHFGLFSGLAAVTHLSSGYLLLPLWLGLLLKTDSRRQLLSPIPIFAALIPITSHLILPLRQLTGHPPYTWGDFTSIDGWWRHVSGWQYRVWLFESSQVWQDNLIDFLKTWAPRMGILALAGLYFLFRDDWRRGFWILSMLVFPVIMISGYRIPDLDTYYLPVYLISIWLGCYAANKLPLERIKQWWLAPAVLGVAVLLLGWWQYPADTRAEDRRQMTYANALLAQLPAPCVLFSSDWEIVVGPLQGLIAQGYRSDVAVIDIELMRRSWYIESLMKRYPHFCRGSLNELNDLIPALRKFERKEEISSETLEQLYRRAIWSLMVNNIAGSAVCFTYDVQPPARGLNGIPLFTVPLLLFSRVQTSNVNYVAEIEGLKIDALYENPAGTRIDYRIREKVATSLLQRAIFLFKQGYRSEAFEVVKYAKNVKPEEGSQFWTMVNLLEREEGRKY